MATLDSILFPVEKLATATILTPGLNLGNNQISNAIIIEPDPGIKELIATVGDSYALTPNQVIFPRIEEILKDKHINFTADYTNHKNRRFYGDYVLTDSTFALAKQKGKDDIQPKFRIGNSYDGSLKAIISFGFYRQVCGNGLMGIKYETHKFKHYDNVTEIISNLPNLILQYLESSEVLVKQYFEVLTDKVVENYADRVIEVVCATKLFKPELISKGQSIGFTEETQYVISKIQSEMMLLDLNKSNDWLIYNALNSYIFDNNINKKSNTVREELDKKVFEYISNS